MRKTMITIATLLVVSIAGAMSAPDAVARSAALDAEAFWRCPAGFSFAVNGNAAHCKKASYTDRKTLAACMIGLYPAADQIGTRDMCAGTNPITGQVGVERACKPEDAANGYTKRVVSGTDFCGKLIPETIIAPSVMVTLTN